MNVGTRELKNRLSHYLRRVRENGESLYVTDRGEVVAELRPVRADDKPKSNRAVFSALIAKGDVSMGTGRFKDIRPVTPKVRISVSSIVVEDRR